jgi:hypothetical protein
VDQRHGADAGPVDRVVHIKDLAKFGKDLGVTQSMGRENESRQCPAESLDNALKREVLQANTYWPEAATCRRQVFGWLARNNTKREHSHRRCPSRLTTSGPTHPLRCQKPNTKSRVYYTGEGPRRFPRVGPHPEE